MLAATQLILEGITNSSKEEACFCWGPFFHWPGKMPWGKNTKMLPKNQSVCVSKYMNKDKWVNCVWVCVAIALKCIIIIFRSTSLPHWAVCVKSMPQWRFRCLDTPWLTMQSRMGPLTKSRPNLKFSICFIAWRQAIVLWDASGPLRRLFGPLA